MKRNQIKLIIDLFGGKLKSVFRQPYWKDRIVLAVLFLSLAINIALWVFLKIFIKPGPVPLTLHYTIYFGPDLLGEAWQVLTIPLVGLVIILINVFLGFLIYPRDRFTAYFLLGILPVVQIFLWIGAISLVLINW